MLQRAAAADCCISLLPLLFLGVGVAAVAGVRARAARRRGEPRRRWKRGCSEITAEFERNFAQLAELRVEQVTEQERKRIAADLHDDLGAKLLTIVHTSESERISTLAREALEEMRLSVRGLTGKPVRLTDALGRLARREVSRLGQAEHRGRLDAARPRRPSTCCRRAPIVQTTRILREAVSNIIKHSGASHCKVRCSVAERRLRADDPGQRQGHPDGARRQARPRARHVEHEAPRQADCRASAWSSRVRATEP